MNKKSATHKKQIKNIAIKQNLNKVMIIGFLGFFLLGGVFGAAMFKGSKASTETCRSDYTDSESVVPGSNSLLETARRAGNNYEENLWLVYLSGTQLPFEGATENQQYFYGTWLPGRVSLAKTMGAGKVSQETLANLDGLMAKANETGGDQLTAEKASQLAESIILNTMTATQKNNACTQLSGGA